MRHRIRTIRGRRQRRGPGTKAGAETGIRLVVADAAAPHKELVERGVDVGEPLRRPGVPPMFSLRDPDGNGLEVVQERFDKRHVWLVTPTSTAVGLSRVIIET